MSNGWQLEVGEWGDGSLRLAFWDSQGKDRIYQIDRDKTIWRKMGYTLDDEGKETDIERWEAVNLHDDLRDLLQMLDGRNK